MKGKPVVYICDVCRMPCYLIVDSAARQPVGEEDYYCVYSPELIITWRLNEPARERELLRPVWE